MDLFGLCAQGSLGDYALAGSRSIFDPEATSIVIAFSIGVGISGHGLTFRSPCRRQLIPGSTPSRKRSDPPPGFKYLVTEMVCWATGGPQKYTGRSMYESHKDMKITGPEWDAFMDDFQQTLDKFSVPRSGAGWAKGNRRQHTRRHRRRVRSGRNFVAPQTFCAIFFDLDSVERLALQIANAPQKTR
jgi:hypothetical protein